MQWATARTSTIPGTGTCFTQSPTYSAGGSCTVDVQFSPASPGPLYGSVSLYNDASTPAIVGTALLQGTGVAPQVVFSPSTVATLGGGFAYLLGIAVDSSGDIYVTDNGDGVIKSMPAGCASSSCVVSLGGGFSNPAQLALDGAGNIYLADYDSSAVKELTANCTSAACVTTLGGGFYGPWGVAVDGSGNVYVADSANNLVKEMPPGCASSACVTTLGGGFKFPSGVAVDGSGNIYVADTNNDEVKKMPGGCASSSCVTTLGGGFSEPYAVALDAAGNIYVADNLHNSLKEIPPGCMASACVSTLYSNFSHPTAIALDSGGNVYATRGTDPGVAVEIKRATPPSLTFATTPAGQLSTDSPQTAIVQNIGNATLTISNLSYPFDFPVDINVPASECPGTGSLAPSATCTETIDFLPFPESVTGASTTLNETVDLTDNNLNGSNVTQSVSVSGTVTAVPASLSSPANNSTFTGTQVKFIVECGFRRHRVQLTAGNHGGGEQPLWLRRDNGHRLQLPQGLPTNGETIYGQLITYYGSATVFEQLHLYGDPPRQR